ncbi:facilitated trehalose transporter Tret1 [Leptinotarsa decemlineata]|uniref:facilitated trehalose transporter Tret1 n=1 Tax=Leptinotarsa decemlineata TaxID=7539 RepID=UPI003D306E6F
MGVLASVNTKKSSGSRIYQYIAAITANLGIICSEMHYGWPSPFVPTLQSGQYHFQISSEEGSWLVVAPLVGAIFGAFVTALIVDRFGRKRLIIFSSLPFVTSWLLIGFADSSTLMFVGRVLAGAADGLSFTAVPMYLGEIADPKIRGLLASLCPVCIVFGILLINIFGAYLALDTVAYIGTIFPILLLVTFSWMPESPYYLLMHDRTAEARKSLQTFRGVEEVTEELTRISGAIQEQADNRGSVFDLVTVKGNRKGLFTTLGLRGIQQLSGTTAIIFYCKTIFKEAEGFISSSLATIIYFSVQLFLSALTSFVVDISGRRPLLIVSTTGTALTLLLNGVFLYLKNCTEVDTSSFDFVPLVALLCFVVVFSVGLQTIPLLVMGEIYPTSVKAIALCFMDIFYSVIVILISKFFHWSNDTYGMHVPFFTFSCCCLLGLVFIVFYVPETKGKTLEDIQAELRGQKQKAAVRYVEGEKFY